MKTENFRQAIPIYNEIEDLEASIAALLEFSDWLEKDKKIIIQIHQKGLHVKFESLNTDQCKYLIDSILSFARNKSNELNEIFEGL